MDKKLNVHIKPLGVLDLLAFKKLVPNRQNIIARGTSEPIIAVPPVNILARAVHPAVQNLIVREVIEENKEIISYKLVPNHKKGTDQCAYFRAGQYLSIKIEIDGHPVTRPVSISSSPKEALQGYYM